jgi:multidrug efflux pump subunit AcrA (membrane-fusion protein)
MKNQIRTIFFRVLLVVTLGARITLGQTDGPTLTTDLAIDGAILKTIETTSVSAQATGMISLLDIKEGAKVQTGQVLGKIRDAGISLQSERAKVAIEVAKKKQGNDIDKRLALKNRAVAENEYKRAVDANSQVRDVYPANELDRLRLLFDRATLESERTTYIQEMAGLDVSIAEIEYRQSLELLERYCITAPCEGVVVAVEKRAGEWVEPGSILLKIVQMDKLRIEGFINSDDASADLLECKATVQVQSGGKLVEKQATVSFISPDANPLNAQVRVFLEVDNRDGRLRPGQRPKTSLHRIDKKPKKSTVSAKSERP